MPSELKARIDKLSKRTGESAHALMLRALEARVEALERYQAFLDDGMRADEASLDVVRVLRVRRLREAGYTD
ncbi:MAG: hypothetical protein ABI423_13315 [Burkholderiales bacterium]